MKVQKIQYETDEASSLSQTVSPCIGQLAGMDESGEIFVRIEGQGPFAAKLVAGLDREILGLLEMQGREALIVFEQGDPRRPIIIAMMENRLESLIDFEISGAERLIPEEAVIDGKRVIIEAEQELVLKCGKGSIQIRKDGRIIIKGTELLSRASGAQRIRGASVNIN
jgi:hypothetical protein